MNRKKYPHIEFRSGNIFEVELESNFYDLVVASELIEHLERENHPNFFRLLHRTLSPEGRFILSTPNKDQMKFPGTQPIENWLTHEELRDLLSPHFQLLSIETARFFFNNLFLDRTWLLLSFPFNPYLIEPWVKKTLRGKYFIVAGKKKS